MPGPQPQPICLTPEQKTILEQLARCRTEAQGIGQRAKILLAAAEGQSNEQIGRGLRMHRQTVRSWRARWGEAVNELRGVSGEAGARRLGEVLADAPRPGGPTKFSAEQLCQLMALACEPPSDSGRSVTHWTPTELADEAVKRKIVEQISARHVGRFLKGGRTQTASRAVLAHEPAGGEPGAI